MYLCTYLKYTEHSKGWEGFLVLSLCHEGCPPGHFQLFREECCCPVGCLQRTESVPETGGQTTGCNTQSAYFKLRKLCSLLTFLSCFPLKQHHWITLEEILLNVHLGEKIKAVAVQKSKLGKNNFYYKYCLPIFCVCGLKKVRLNCHIVSSWP